MEKYEVQLYRYNALSKSKDAGMTTEEAFVLHEVRKAYIKESLDMTHKLIAFKYVTEHIIPYQLLLSLDNHASYHEESADLLMSIQPMIKRYESNVMDTTESQGLVSEKLNGVRKEVEDPTDPETLSLVQLQKEGYLFRKKAAGLNASWAKRYCLIDGGCFYYISQGKTKSKIVASAQISINKSSFQAVKVDDRRFCFEITNESGETLYLQAESFKEMKSWLLTLAAAKLQQSGEPQSQERLSHFNDDSGANSLALNTPQSNSQNDLKKDMTPTVEVLYNDLI